jgi:hypothetical protein
VTGPGDVDRFKKGEGVREGLMSFAPSTMTGIAGDGGLLVADDSTLLVYSKAPSLWSFLMTGGVALGEPLPVGVPN